MDNYSGDDSAHEQAASPSGNDWGTGRTHNRRRVPLVLTGAELVHDDSCWVYKLRSQRGLRVE